MFTLILCIPILAHAADKKELQARFEKRYPQVLQYKTQGNVGETTSGLLEAVDPKYLSDATLKKLIEDENADRQELYAIIAKDENTTPQIVAERTAQRNFQKAHPGDYLKQADGKWTKKS
jgi:uncharacterized protein YdbL (DUF1318 family)